MELAKLDSYLQFFEIVDKDAFFRFGIDNIIIAKPEIAKNAWNNLLKNINAKSDNLFVRSSGRYAVGNDILRKLYADVFGININFDPTNNDEPTKLIQDLTGYYKRGSKQNIFNYQVSHVFGRTKNVFLFTAPWNIVFVPKVLDPLTGHEAKGDFVEEFKSLFVNKVKLLFKHEIEEYNLEMTKYLPKLLVWVKENVDKNKQSSILKDFTLIEM